MKQRRYIFSILILLSALALGGWGSKKELLKDSKPLINLKEAILSPAPGSNSSVKDDSENASEDDSGKSKSEISASVQKPVQKSRLYISVRGRSVSYNSEILEDPEQVRDRIEKDRGKHRFILKDNYAESHVYKRVIDILNESGAEWEGDL